MNFMMQEENRKLAATQSDSNLVYIAVGAVVVVLAVLIMKKKFSILPKKPKFSLQLTL